MARAQSHRHLRRDRLDPHAVDVTAPADHAAADSELRGLLQKIVKAIDDLVGQRLLLCEGAQPELNRLVAHGLARGVPAGTAPSAETFPHGAMTRAGRSGHFK